MREWVNGESEFLPDALAEDETTEEAGSGVGMFMYFLGEAIKKFKY